MMANASKKLTRSLTKTMGREDQDLGFEICNGNMYS